MNANWTRKIFSEYGQAVAVVRGTERRTLRAFLQPVAERDETELFTMTALGSVDDRLWKYLGPEELTAEDRVAWNGLTFRVRSCRPHCVGERVEYWWAMLEREKEAAV